MKAGRSSSALLRAFLLGWAVTLSAGGIYAAESEPAASIVLLANSDDPDSLRIAQHYAEVRGVPRANIVALSMPLSEAITWKEFVGAIWRPLLEQLIAAGWIDAQPMALTDAIGRRKYAPRGHRITALVVCRGVPLKIAHEPEFFVEQLPLTKRTEFRTNAGAVDSELSLLTQPNYPINALLANPLFQNERPTAFELSTVVKVSRLDGPTADDANALVDRAVAAERHGLLGRAYVDLAHRDKVGDMWLEATAAQLTVLGFETVIDRESATLPAAARFDAPALYFGWYASDVNGPFALPGFRFPPGAIALHIHSYSAATLRQASSGWAGPLVARGVTATVGNVLEPYLQFTHRPDLLLRALARGATWVDAAYYSLPALSWQSILIGDPLYRPFAASNEEQLRNLTQLPSRLAGYAVLRRMRQLDAAGRSDEATALAMATQRENPSLAVAVALAGRLLASGNTNRAAAALVAAAARREEFVADEWMLACEAAKLLEGCGRARDAVALWQRLFAVPSLPRELRIAWLPEAQNAAQAAGDARLARTWQDEHAQLASENKK